MRSLRVSLCLLAAVVMSAMAAGDMTKLTVQVNSADTGKPIDRATVIVRFKHGMGVNLKKIQTTWETKTNQDGKVSIPAIHQGEVTIQITAKDFQTFGNVYELNEENQTVAIKLNRPQSQYSEDAKHP
jgi:5-hydroxyisourate hydrolase-like protein (transthyretin family)